MFRGKGFREALIVLTIFTFALCPYRVSAQTRFFNEFTIPFGDNVRFKEPHGIVIDQSGVLWFALTTGHAIVRYDPASSQFSKYDVPGGTQPTEVALDSKGNIWFTEYLDGRLGVVRLHPGYYGLYVDQFAIPTPASQPGIVAADALGNIWFTESLGNKIGVFSPSNGSFREWRVPTSNSIPYGLCIDEQNRIWFTESKGNKLGVLDARSGKIQEFKIPTPASSPEMCLQRKDTIWFTEMEGNKIAAFDMSNLTFVEYPTPTPGSWPWQIAADSAGNIWFTELQGNNIGRLALQDLTIDEWAIPTECECIANSLGLVITPSDKVWFTEDATGKLASLTPPNFYVKFNAIPQAPITVDGKKYDTVSLPILFKWNTGTEHSVSVPDQFNLTTDSRYVFTKWSDGQASSQRQIQVQGYSNFTAYGKTQYLLQISSNYGNPAGAGWYDAGSNVLVAIENSLPQSGYLGYIGSKFVFDHWTGDLSGNLSKTTILLDSPKHLIAVWRSEVPLWPIEAAALSTVFVVISTMLVRRRLGVVRLSNAGLSDLKVGARVKIEALGNVKMRVQEIREGGMGLIFVCSDRTGRKLAIKTYKQPISGDTEVSRKIEKRFNQEAALWVGLGVHPNIVRAISFAKMRDRPYLLLEFIEGRNLRNWIGSGELALNQSLKLASGICSGLAYAAGKSVMHRDIKPENILIDKNLVAKVTDFGLARVIDEEAGTMSQDLTGTLAYMSPEQFSPDGFVDERSDIYSFGLVLYEMVTSENPFRADSPGELIALHRERIPEPPSSRQKSVPSQVDNLVMRCLEKNPAKRFQTFYEILAALSTLPQF